MKKLNGKKIILSIMISSMMWSNNLYAMELTGVKNEEDLKIDDNFKLIDNDPNRNVYTTTNIQDKIIIVNNADINACISNVEKVENSEVDGVYGGYGYNTNNNVIKISDSAIYDVVAGGAYGESNNYNTLIIENSDTGINVFGGGYGSNNNFNNVTLKNTTANTTLGFAAGGYYIYDSSVGKSTDNVNVLKNTINVIAGDIENLFGGRVDNANRLIKNIDVAENTVKIDNLGKSEKFEEIDHIIGGAVIGKLKDMLDGVKWNSSTNNLKIQNSYIELDNDIRQVEKNIAGGYVKIDKTQSFNGIVTANNNRVDIINSYVDAGGENQKINGGYVSEISDNFTGFTSADNNIVNIDKFSIW